MAYNIPLNVPAYNNLANVLQGDGQIGLAIELDQQALSLARIVVREDQSASLGAAYWLSDDDPVVVHLLPWVHPNCCNLHSYLQTSE